MPYIVDVPLQDKKFTAKVHSRPSGSQMQAMNRAARQRAKEDDMTEVLYDNLLIMCEGWDVTDENGTPIPWSREGLHEATWEILQELSERAGEFVNRGVTFDQKLKELAESLDEDDPRREQLLAMVDSGN